MSLIITDCLLDWKESSIARNQEPLCPTCQAELGAPESWKNIQHEIFNLKKALRKEKIKVNFLRNRLKRLKKEKAVKNLMSQFSLESHKTENVHDEDEVICFN